MSATWWPSQQRTSLPAAADCAALLEAVTFDVPSRAEGRSKEHREGYCIIRALRWLSDKSPRSSPATLIRQESPDFLLEPCSQQTIWAFEQTDAGEQDYQLHLAESEDGPSIQFVPSRNAEGKLVADGAWVGNAPERAFAAAINETVTRKREPKVWRCAPTGAVHVVLMYDQTNSGMFVGDVAAQRALEDSYRSAVTADDHLHLMLVRGDDRLLHCGANL